MADKEDAKSAEVIFCCFSEKDVKVYETIAE